MTAPHDPGPQLPPDQIESLSQSIIQAFGAIADHIKTITGMTPAQIQASIDQLPEDQRAALIQRIQGQIPPMG